MMQKATGSTHHIKCSLQLRKDSHNPSLECLQYLLVGKGTGLILPVLSADTA